MIKNLISNNVHNAIHSLCGKSNKSKVKKIHSAFDYFYEKSLKNGDLFSYSMGTTPKELMLRAKKLGGILQYVAPSDPDYKFGNAFTMRVVYPIK